MWPSPQKRWPPTPPPPSLSLSLPQAKLAAVAEIVATLRTAVAAGRDVNLNALKHEVCGGRGRRRDSVVIKTQRARSPSHPPPSLLQVAERHRLNKAPKLVDIIAAVPEEARDQLLPR